MSKRDRWRPLPAVWLMGGILLGICHASPGLTSYTNTGLQDGASKTDPAAIFQAGKQALQSGQLSLAEEAFLRVIELDPTSAAASINLGVVYIRQKRWDDALTTLRKAEKLAPNEPGIQLNIGLAYYKKSDFPSAIKPFSESVRLAPASLQPRYLLGLCYFFTNQYKEAADMLAPIWEKESTNLNYLYVLSIAASKSSNPALEKQAVDRMVTVGQDTPEFHLYLGKAWLAEDDPKKALKEFESAAAVKPNLPLVHYFLGRTYLEQHEYPRAEVELLKDASIEPDFAYNYEDLGILHAQRGETAEAEHYFREAIARNASLVNSYFGLAKLYRDSARYPEALEMLNRAEGLVPQSASLHYTRGQVLAKLGKTAQAKEEFDTAAKMLKSFNDRIQQDPSGDRSADAQDAVQQ